MPHSVAGHDSQTAACKHVIHAQRLQEDILAAHELWQGHTALGKVLLQLGQEKDAAEAFNQALQTAL